MSACWKGHSKNQVDAARTRLGRSARPTLLIVDAQSVKNTDIAAHKGYDAGKKISGIKRHIAVDTQGLPHAVAITTAEVTGRQVRYKRSPAASLPWARCRACWLTVVMWASPLRRECAIFWESTSRC